MRPGLAFVAALALLASPAAAASRVTTESTARSVCSFTDVETIGESSGVAASSRRDDVVFTHNDSGDSSRFFGIGSDCRLLATYVIPGVDPRDVEGIARAQDSIWLGDIGDNRSRRSSVKVYRVPEPVVETTRGAATVRTLRPDVYTLTYPDGAHDAETLLVSPEGRMWIVTKSFFGDQHVYEAPEPLRPDTATTLEKVATVGPAVGPVTDGDLSADGRRVVLRDYSTAYEWDLDDVDVARAVGRSARRVELPSSPQGEGVGFTRDGSAWWTTSESTGDDSWPLGLVSPDRTADPAETTRGKTESDATGDESTDPDGSDGRPIDAIALAGAVGLVLAAGLLSRRYFLRRP